MTDSRNSGPDRAELRRAALRIAVRISVACGALVLCLLAVATVYLFSKAGGPSADHAEPGAVFVSLDTGDLIRDMIVVGFVGVVLAGVVGWLSARSSIRPLADALARQRRFVQDASHELRTPLAILDARVQLAQRTSSPDSPTGLALARIREDTAALTELVDGLLEAATAGEPTPDTPSVDVGALAAEVVEGATHLADARRVTLGYSGQAGAAVVISPQSLRRALLALVDNALAHTPDGGRVDVTVAEERGQVTLTVADTGSGISDVDRQRIFERFVHSSSDSAGTGRRGYGIGLALVREIASQAGGRAEIARTGAEGTVMRIVLPKARRKRAQA
ncbi:sensor histidine kinase [Arthrobacter sp. RAF14]|uniref:sensor histidine kinase n=1 Tax=Arthrobacter sp. RAF14 TaxID=3233051 RepID=UPI003F8E5CEB